MDDHSSRAADDPEAVTSIDPAELSDRLRAGESVSALDLRDRDEVEEWPLAGADATNLPYARALQAAVTGELRERVGDLAEPVVVVCPRGDASAEVAGLLEEAGVDAVNLAGGVEAWARLYRVRGLDAGGSAAVLQYDRPSSGCLSYLVHDGRVGAVVDPLRAFAERYVEDAAELGLELRYAVDTHVHADHVSGVRRVAALGDAEPVLPAGARDRGLAFEATLLADGDGLAVGDATLAAVHAPGHTTEMTALRVGDAVLTGDSLFLDGVARPDLEDPAGAEAYAGRLYETLRELGSLPDGTVVAPGHREPGATPEGDGTYAAPLAAVRERVDVLDLDRGAFVDRVTARTPPRPANHERIVRVNLGREDVDAEEAFELELGPNNCAAAAD